MGRWSRPVAEAALAWLAPSPGLTWLDVGCGTGALTEAILGASKTVDLAANPGDA
jgi:precorrin-6B methylase 2